LKKEIFVAILEDDNFSRQWMALLLVRDWRTRVVGEFGNQAELYAFLEKPSQPVDILIVDADLLSEIFTIQEVSRFLASKDLHTKILLTGVQPDPKLIRQFDNARVWGYLLKSEIEYSLSWVMTFLEEGYRILTPATKALADKINYRLPSQVLVVRGKNPHINFTEHEMQAARLAFIFSLGRRDLADELKISEQWSYGLVSELYKKMGLTDLISGEVDLFTQIGVSTVLIVKFQEIIDKMGSSKKASDMETLAFHLLTMPELLQ
jgi:DNA-binding NarL/FixJ family response regulator